MTASGDSLQITRVATLLKEKESLWTWIYQMIRMPLRFNHKRLCLGLPSPSPPPDCQAFGTEFPPPFLVTK